LFSLTITNIYARQAIWRDFDNMKDFVSAIRNREINDDNINWKKFQTSDVYQDENDDPSHFVIMHKIVKFCQLSNWGLIFCFLQH